MCGSAGRRFKNINRCPSSFRRSSLPCSPVSFCHAIHAFRIPPRASLPCPALPGPTLPLLPCLLRVRQRERGRQDVINSLQWMMIDVGDNCRRAFDHRHLTDSQTQAALRAGPGPPTATGWRYARARERGATSPLSPPCLSGHADGPAPDPCHRCNVGAVCIAEVSGTSVNY